jgi:DNA-directed RNA polymerase subunit omega
MTDSMINPSIVDLLTKVDNRYSLVIITSKRARQIIDGSKPLIDTEKSKPLTVAINELHLGAISYETVKEGIK